MKIFCYSLSIFFLFFCGLASAEDIKEKKTVCLNMIVKDESSIITRCLQSVKPIIDYWVIVDTGSSDRTIDTIKEFMKDIPGEVHERPWKNFAHNRNQALELAKGKADYVLLMDADDVLEYDDNFKLPELHLDLYNSIIIYSSLQYDRPLLIKDKLDWKWYGVLHEYLSAPERGPAERLQGIRKMVKTDGNRSKDEKKYEKDAKLLEDALKEDPTNSRYMFYLAQSYRDAGNRELSLKNYAKRVEMGGWDEEVFYSMLQVARLQQDLGMSPEIFLKSFYDAYHYRPSRIEPLLSLARYYRGQNDFAQAYTISSIGMSVPMPKDSLFIEKTAYDYDMALECSINAYWIGKYHECQAISKNLLNKTNLPEHVREIVEKNIGFANKKLIEQLGGYSPKNLVPAKA